MNFDILRQKILEKAIRGELVPQLENEPETVQIGDSPKEVPFTIPKKWKWLKLSSVFRLKAGKFISSSEIKEAGKYPCFGGNGIRGYVDHYNKEGKFPLIGRQGALCGNINIADGRFYATEHAVVADGGELIDSDCAAYFLKQLNLNQYATKTAQPGISVKRISETPFPLPSLEEQRRIVTKINQLFEQIDCAEKAYNELSGPLSERFRQLCLEKAIQGKLVPQLESEPEVEQVGDAPEDVPFEIPEKWRWMQLNKVGKIVGGGTPKTSLSEYWDGGTIPWFTPADLGKVHGLYASGSARKITALGLKESSAVMMPPNSVLFSSRAPIGHIALAADSCCTNQGCKSFVPNVGIVLPLWGYFAMKARTPDMIARASGTTFKEISGKGVGETLVPIPPLEEQRRIVTKLSEILNVVRQLENSVLIS